MRARAINDDGREERPRDAPIEESELVAEGRGAERGGRDEARLIAKEGEGGGGIGSGGWKAVAMEIGRDTERRKDAQERRGERGGMRAQRRGRRQEENNTNLLPGSGDGDPGTRLAASLAVKAKQSG